MAFRWSAALVLWSCLAAAVWSGRAEAGPKYKTFVLAKPEIVLEGVRKIAVRRFEGKLGDKLADRLSGQLVRGNRGVKAVGSGFMGLGKEKVGTHIVGGRTDLYEVIARAELSDLLDEIELSNTGITDDIIEFGRIKGIDAYVLGSVSYAHSDAQSKSEYGEKPTYKIERTLSLQGMVKVVSVGTGQVLGQKSFRREGKDAQTSSEGFRYIRPKSPEVMVEPLLTKMAEDMAAYFSPYYKARSFEFEEILNKKFAKLGKKAEKFIKKRDIVRAHNIYLHIHEQDPYGPKAAYNLGMFNEMVGNYEVAQEYYERAYGLKQKKDYKKALDRAERNLVLRDMLEEAGVEIEPFDFEDGAGADAAARTVWLKGSSAERFKVRAEDRKAGEVIAEVPGGMEYTLLEEGEKWVLIELIDGKTGYVRAKNVAREPAR